MKKLCVIRRVLCSFLAAAMMISAVGCNGDKISTANNNSLNSARKINNYFTSKEYECPEEIGDISNMECADHKMYILGSRSASSSQKKVAIYDTSTGEKSDIDVSSLDVSFYNYVYLSDQTVYIVYSDESSNNMTHLCAISRSTGEKINDIEIDQNTYPLGIFINQDDDLCMTGLTYSAVSSQSLLMKLDKNTLEVKEKINLNEKLNISDKDNEMIMKVIPCSDGSYYAFSIVSDEGDNTTIYKLSPKFEIMYKLDNTFDDMPGYFDGSAFFRNNGNLCVMTRDDESGSDIYYTNELDAATGETIQRYESKLQDVNIPAFPIIEGYDFFYRKEGKLFGYDVVNNKETEIVDCTKQLGEEYSECDMVSLCGTSLLLAAQSYGAGEESLLEIDSDGKILNNTALPENSQTQEIKVSKDGLISVICSNYSQDDDQELCELCTIDNQGNEKSRIPLNLEKSDEIGAFLQSFLINSKGEICASYYIYDKNSGGGSNKNIIVVFDSDGNEKFRIDDDSIQNVQGMITSESGDYVYYQGKTGSELSKIDYENKKMSEKIDVGVCFKRIYPGDEKYDFYYDDCEGIYGYNIKDKKSAEIINWIDSDIDSQISKACMINSDKIMIQSYDMKTGAQSVFQLDRVSDEDLKLIQNKKIITVAGVGITNDETKKSVVKFNKENVKYRIQVNDYSKYDSYEDDEHLSGTDQLNNDLATGTLPDILIGNSEVDMQTYISKGLLTDLNPFIDKDEDISREDYFENIFDIYSTDGKLYQLVTDFNITTMFGKQSDLGDKSGWTFDEFFKFADGKNIFYKTERNDLLNYVKNNLSEYVDFKNKTCQFNNDNFVKLLELIKKEGLTQEEIDDQKYYGDNGRDEEKYKEYLGRFENKKCYLENDIIYSFDILANLQQFVLNDSISFIGFPSSSSQGNGTLIYADATIGISDKSEVKDAAWDFIRGFMLEEYQKGMNEEYSHTFPVMKSAFEDLAKKSQSSINQMQGQNYKGETATLNPLDSKTIEKFSKLVENTSKAVVSNSRINKIITEQTDIFFEDGQSAKEAAEAIQSKVSLYLKEIK